MMKHLEEQFDYTEDTVVDLVARGKTLAELLVHISNKKLEFSGICGTHFDLWRFMFIWFVFVKK